MMAVVETAANVAECLLQLIPLLNTLIRSQQALVEDLQFRHRRRLLLNIGTGPWMRPHRYHTTTTTAQQPAEEDDEDDEEAAAAAAEEAAELEEYRRQCHDLDYTGRPYRKPWPRHLFMQDRPRRITPYGHYIHRNHRHYRNIINRHHHHHHRF